MATLLTRTLALKLGSYSLLAAVVALSGLVCRGNSNGDLTEQERQAIYDVVRPVGSRVGFSVIVPAYLPKAISRDVKADSHSNERVTEATMVFPARDSDDSENGVQRVIVIEEPDPKSKYCPPNPSETNNGYVTNKVAGHVVADLEVITRTREITHDMRFCASEVHVIVQVVWATESEKLPDDMRREDFRIVESFFEQK